MFNRFGRWTWRIDRHRAPGFGSYIDPGTGWVVATAVSWLLGLLAGVGALAALAVRRIRDFLFRKRRFLGVCLVVSMLAYGAYYAVLYGQRLTIKHRIVLFSVDGLDADRVESMMGRGLLPAFSGLAASGGYRRLQTTFPPQSPVAWASLSTGTLPGKHGVFDFVRRDQNTYLLSLSTSKIESGHPVRVKETPDFWTVASDLGVPTAVIGLPLTFPPEPLNGVQLSGMGTPDIRGTQGTYTFFSSDPDDLAGANPRVVPVERFNTTAELQISGPGTQSGAAVATFSVNQAATDSVAIRIQGQVVDVQEGRWSDWVDVRFEQEWAPDIDGIFRFFLAEVSPDLRLYAGPVNIDPRAPHIDISYPADFAASLAGEIGLFHTQGIPFDTWPVNDGLLDLGFFERQVETIVDERQKMLDHTLGRFPDGLIVFYIEEADMVQHMFMRDDSGPGGVIEKWYRAVDNTLAGLLDKLGPNDQLLVVSDHGFASFDRAVHLNAWLRDHGFLSLQPGAVIDHGLAAIDWARTRAYAVGFNSLYLNLKDREGAGIVQPGEVDDLLDELSAGLADFVDPASGQPVVSRVVRGIDAFGSDHPDAPDLVVGYYPGFRASWNTALGQVPGPLIEDNTKAWSGDHLIDPEFVPGVLFCNSDIPATVSEPHLVDLAPTILAMLGLDPADIEQLTLDGTVLLDVNRGRY